MPSFIVYDLLTGQVQGKYQLSHAPDLQEAILVHTTPAQRALVVDDSLALIRDTSPLVVQNGVLVTRRELVIQITNGFIQTFPMTFNGPLLASLSDGTATSVTVSNGVAILPLRTVVVQVPQTDPTYYSKRVVAQ